MRTRAVLVVLCLAACSSSPNAGPTTSGPGGSTATPGSGSSAASTTSSPVIVTTTSGGTPSSASGPTTTQVGSFGFQPACKEVAAHGTTPTSTKQLDAFEPLGHDPALRITLPMGSSQDVPTPQAAEITGALRIPGGVLLAIGASEYGFFDGGILAAVNTDGSVRWVRCLDHRVSYLAVAAAETDPTQALIEVSTPVAAKPSTDDWRRISLDTGADQIEFADVLRARGITIAVDQPLARREPLLLLGPNPDAHVDPTVDQLVLVDLTDWSARSMPYPDSLAGTATNSQIMGITASGEVAVQSYTLGALRATAVRHNGTWSTSPSLLQTANGPAVAFGGIAADGSDDRSLRGYNAAGVLAWHNANITSFGGEGFELAVAGSITVVSACFHASITDDCTDDAGVAGIDTSTGKVRWKLAGRRNVSLVADGLALVTDTPTATDDGTFRPGPWMMIDITTGKPASSERWADPETFRQGCCGESGIVSVVADGGVVFAANYEHLAIWYPASAHTSTHDVEFG